MNTPMRPARRARNLAELFRVDRTHVFVPAIMGAGLLFWLIGEVRDLLRSAGDASRDKRAHLIGQELVDRLPGQPAVERGPECKGLRSRPIYLLWALALIGGAAYVSIGSVGNYTRHDGYVSDIAWLLSLACIVSAALLVLGVVAAATFLTFPNPPRWCQRILQGSLLTTNPLEPGIALTRPSWQLSALFSLTGALAALSVLVVGGAPSWVRGFDNGVADWFTRVDMTWWSPVTDALYGWIGVAALAVIALVGAVRCRALTAAYLTTVALGAVATIGLQGLIDKTRPPAGPYRFASDSFPSGHVLQAVLVAVLFPLVAETLLRRRTITLALQTLLALMAAATVADVISGSKHWPSDTAGGIFFGLALGFGGRWVIADQRSHVRCRSCPWAIARTIPLEPLHRHRRIHDTAHHAATGLIALGHQPARLIRLAAHISSFLVVVTLTVMSFTVGLPQNGSGYVFGASVERPAQLALAGLVSVGAILARKWPAIGATMMAVAAAGLGVFASVEYAPGYAVLLAAMVMLPAFLLWLSWQHRRAPHELTAVAAITVLLMGGTWFGARSVYDTYFGATHPDSAAAPVGVDRVDWVLAGRLGSDTISVNARLVDTTSTAVLRVTSTDGVTTIDSPAGTTDANGVTHLRVTGLAPGTSYEYRVVVDGTADTGRGFGEFRTPVNGPMSFDVIVASCARTSSNGAVFDAMAAEDALLYLALGDAHYGNITSTTVKPFLDAYDRLLTQPGQAAFYRSTPLAYVWDDHDYGPNDADSTSPGRAAVAEAFRSVVPSYPLADDTAVYQAFSIGRVRFVMTDSRSQRTADTMLGPKQLAWLIDELVSSSRTHALVVWANPVPWVGAASPGAQGWAGIPDERRTIADAIEQAGVHNLVMVSGDAHMVAIDDGTNTNYSSNPSARGFPLLHAAALDRPGSVKGGPYSGGTFPGGGHYGKVSIVDDGTTIRVTLSGHTWDNTVLASGEFTFDASTRAR